MTIKTTEERLLSVQKAIEAIETGAQQYQINGRMLTRGSLPELYRQEKYLERKLAREQRGGIRIRGATPV